MQVCSLQAVSYGTLLMQPKGTCRTRAVPDIVCEEVRDPAKYVLVIGHPSCTSPSAQRRIILLRMSKLQKLGLENS